jgi:indolepyruvate ferredoxin oxidoreductase, beta subunit
MTPLKHNPYNLVITGVGGQGNVMASRLIGNMLSLLGYKITIGETFGASQRGGAVRSDLRISEDTAFSPQIPKGRAHMIVAMEPAEAIRVLGELGNPDVKVICNMRPIYSVNVICGEFAYPTVEQHRQWLSELSGRVWLLNTTDEAVKLGNPIFSNIMLIGALAGTGDLPLERHLFETVIAQRLPADKVEKNLAAFDKGRAMTMN